jgi:hypothetical protein
MKILKAVSIFLFISFLAIGCGSSGGGGGEDPPPTTTVSGTVLDNNNNPIAGAEVTIMSDPVTVITDTEGKFTATVEIGTHTIEIKKGAVLIHSGQINCEENTPLSLSSINYDYNAGSGEPISDYYPLDTGNTWTWVANSGITRVVDEFHTFSGGTGQRIESTSNVCVPYDNFVTKNQDGEPVIVGLYDRSKDEYIDIPKQDSFVILQKGMQIGDSWVFDPDEDVTITFTFMGMETVIVPAGTFSDSIRIRAVVVDTDANSATYTTVFWYAKNVGLVKVERTYESPIGHEGCMAVTSANPLAELQSAIINGVSIGNDNTDNASLVGTWEMIQNDKGDAVPSGMVTLVMTDTTYDATLPHCHETGTYTMNGTSMTFTVGPVTGNNCAVPGETKLYQITVTSTHLTIDGILIFEKI